MRTKRLCSGCFRKVFLRCLRGFLSGDSGQPPQARDASRTCEKGATAKHSALAKSLDPSPSFSSFCQRPQRLRPAHPDTPRDNKWFDAFARHRGKRARVPLWRHALKRSTVAPPASVPRPPNMIHAEAGIMSAHLRFVEEGLDYRLLWG
jgi:hypothetical protein